MLNPVELLSIALLVCLRLSDNLFVFLADKCKQELNSLGEVRVGWRKGEELYPPNAKQSLNFDCF